MNPICEFILSVFLTVCGAFLGALIGIKFTKQIEDQKFNISRKDTLKALLESLEKNKNYITQIKTLHFPNNQLPTFPLDTVALAYVALNAAKYLPNDTNWAAKYNGLRFELDHINRKVLMTYISANHNLDAQHNKQVNEFNQNFLGLNQLILNTETTLDREIETLTETLKKLV